MKSTTITARLLYHLTQDSFANVAAFECDQEFVFQAVVHYEYDGDVDEAFIQKTEITRCVAEFTTYNDNGEKFPSLGWLNVPIGFGCISQATWDAMTRQIEAVFYGHESPAIWPNIPDEINAQDGVKIEIFKPFSL